MEENMVKQEGTEPKRWWRGSLYISLVLASLTLNIFFVAGYFIADARAQLAKSAPGRAQLFAEKLALTQDQLAVFNHMRELATRAAEQAQRDNIPDVDAFWTSMTDGARTAESRIVSVRATADRSVELTLEVTRLLEQFMDTLDDKQKQDFIALFRNRPVFQGRFLMTD